MNARSEQDDRRTLSQILILLQKQYGRARPSLSNGLKKIDADIMGKGYSPITLRGIEGAANGSFSTLNSQEYIFLKPPEGEAVLPVIGIDALDWRHFQVCLALFLLDASSDIHAIGMRFETAHGNGGAHDFCHAQFVRSFRNNQPDLPTPPWIPVTQPSIPIDAEDNIGLILCVLVSIYGAVEAWRVLAGDPIVGLKSHMSNLRALGG